MTMLELLTEIVGVPNNDVEWTFLYMFACLIALMFFYFVLYLYKLAANTIRGL